MTPRTGSSAQSSQMVTSTMAIERAALEVFHERGFDETRVEDIAAAAGISRRTFFRYFASKNDILWANFGYLLGKFEEGLTNADDDRPILDVVADATMRFNSVHSDGVAAHRERMRLILHTPTLRAHAALRNAEWREVVARYAANRLGVSPDELAPQVIGYVSIGAANAAYDEWLRDETSDLDEVIHRAFTLTQDLPQ